jgi:hypothetical protein
VPNNRRYATAEDALDYLARVTSGPERVRFRVVRVEP